LSLRDGIAKLIKDEIIGQPIGEDMTDPISGEILAAKGQVISKNLIKKVLSSKVSDIPLEDGRYFSLEGRLLDYLYKNVVGKISAEEIKDPETGELLVSSGKKLLKNVAEISNRRLDLLKIREDNNMVEFDVIENIGFIRRKKLPRNRDADYSRYYPSFSFNGELSFGSFFPKNYTCINQCRHQR